MSDPEKVFPVESSGGSSSSSSGGTIGVGRFKVSTKTAGILGAGGVVILGLVAAQKGASQDDDVDTDAAILDTTDTDVYNDLQGAIEQLTDELGDRPRPPQPTPAQPAGKATRYTVQKGDKLGAIARKYGVTRARLYQRNRDTIEDAAKKHHKKSSQHGRFLYAGTVLVIPKK